MLHIFTQSPQNTELTNQLRTTLGPDDDVILIQDGVYYLLHRTQLEEHFSLAANIYFLKNEAQARGIKSSVANVIGCDYARFVGLTLEHKNNQRW